MERLNRKSIEQLERLMNLPILVFNEDGVLYHNENFRTALHEEKIDPTFHNLYHDLDLSDLSIDQELHIKNSRGMVFYFNVKLERVVFETAPAFYAVLIDIGEKISIKKELNQIQKLRELIIEISNSILESTDLEEFYQYILETALRAIDKTTLGTILVLEDEYLKPVANVGFSDEVMSLSIRLEKTFIYQSTNGKLDRIVNIPDLSIVENYIKIKTKYGEEVQIESTLSAPFHFKGQLYGFINIDSLKKNAFDDSDIKSIEYIVKSIEIAITNRLLYEEKVYLSRYDRVTGLYNRHFFDEQSSILVKKAIRYDESFHLVMIDVDNLKLINDEYSHLMGDEIIAQVAALIKVNIRDSDVFVRYGGDEFVGILFNFQSEHLEKKFDSFNQHLVDHPLTYKDKTIHASISYGIAKFKDDGSSLDDLIRCADARMYEQKNSKKDGNVQ